MTSTPAIEPSAADVADALRTLRELNSLTNGRFGVAAVEVRHGARWTRACNVVILAGGEPLRTELMDLLHTAQPLGRLSAAALLSRFDREAARRAFEQLVHDAGSVFYATGCIMMSEPVSEIASKILRSGVLEAPSPPQYPPHAPLNELAFCSVRAVMVRGREEVRLDAPVVVRREIVEAPGSAVQHAFGQWLVGVAVLLGVLAALYALQR